MDPLHQFHIEAIVPLSIAGIDLSFSNSALWMLIAVASVFGVLELGLRRTEFVPGRLQSLVEMLYNFVTKTVSDTTGGAGRRHVPFVLSLFTFILAGNLLGMIPGAFTFTSHIAVTFALALMVFVLTAGIGFARHGVRYFKVFFPAGAPLWMAPLLIPIEILSYLARPIGLAVRLFANLMAGHTMLKVFAGFSVMSIEALGIAGGLAVAIAPVFINVALTGFEALVAVLQAYVFMVLTCLYLNDALHLEH